MEPTTQNSSSPKIPKGLFDNIQLKHKFRTLQSQYSSLKQKESFYLSVLSIQTIRELKQALAQQKQEKRHLKRKTSHLKSLLQHQLEREAPISNSESQLFSELALSGQIDIQELRYQQQLWEHRHCRNGHCIHRQSDMQYQQLLQLGEQIGSVNIGLSEEEIRDLPLIEVHGEHCSICQSEIDGEVARQLACGHLHHQGCLDSWLASKPTCPVCMRSARDK